jgi:hypothetical protein
MEVDRYLSLLPCGRRPDAVTGPCWNRSLKEGRGPDARGDRRAQVRIRPGTCRARSRPRSVRTRSGRNHAHSPPGRSAPVGSARDPLRSDRSEIRCSGAPGTIRTGTRERLDGSGSGRWLPRAGVAPGRSEPDRARADPTAPAPPPDLVQSDADTAGAVSGLVSVGFRGRLARLSGIAYCLGCPPAFFDPASRFSRCSSSCVTR